MKELSPLKVGDEGLEVELYQGLMGVEETGVWTAQNEIDYRSYILRQDWEIFYKVMNSDGERVLPNWVYA